MRDRAASKRDLGSMSPASAHATGRAAWAQDTMELLDTLPPHAGTVLNLMYFARLSEAEVCARTGWSEHQVRRAGAVGLRELGRLLQARSPA